jgi:replicative DNA helicase
MNRIGYLHNQFADDVEVGKWYGNLRINDENAVPPADVRILVDEYIEEVGVPPRMLIVDYLGYWSRAFKGNSKYEQVTEAIMELKRIAKEYGVTVIAPHQVSRTGDRGRRLELDHARDSGAVEETSDFVLGLYRPHEARENEDDVSATWRQRADVRIDVLKSRHGNVGKEVRMLWAPYSLAMVSASSAALDNKVEKEWKAYDQMKSYEDVKSILAGKTWI